MPLFKENAEKVCSVAFRGERGGLAPRKVAFDDFSLQSCVLLCLARICLGVAVLSFSGARFSLAGWFRFQDPQQVVF